MSFSRREFLLGFGAGLLLPKSWDFYADFLARTGEPYLAAPAATRHTLFVKDCDDEEGPRLLLDFDDHDASVPDFSNLTKRQFIHTYLPDYPEDELEYEWGLDEAVDRWYAFEHWVDRHSPDTKAFQLLKPLDLGRLSDTSDRGEGWIHFVNGPCPGNSSQWVNIDLLGVSVLQQKLIELNLPIQLAMA